MIKEKWQNLVRFARRLMDALKSATIGEIGESTTEETDKARYVMYGFVLGLCANVVVLMIVEAMGCRL